MVDHPLWYLKQIDLFNGISDEEIMSIAERVEERQCLKNDFIYTPVDAIDSVCVLKKGEVTLYYKHYGKKLIIDVLKPGSIFGCFSNTSQGNEHFAEVTEPAYVCIFKVNDFLNIVRQKPELMMRVLEVMSIRLSDYEKRLKDGLFDAKEKIMHYLERRYRKQQGLLGRLVPYRRLTHEQIAEHTGLSRETVTRGLSALKKQGLVSSQNTIVT